MAWQETMTCVLRNMIDDTDSTNYTYSDSRLEELILSAAQLVKTRISTIQTYTISVADCEFSPDPTLEATQDDSFVNLVLIKAACIVVKSEAKNAARQGIVLRHDDTSIDLRARAETKLALLKDKHNYCAEFEQLILEYKLNRISGVVGESIVGPFRSNSDYRPYNSGWSYRN